MEKYEVLKGTIVARIGEIEAGTTVELLAHEAKALLQLGRVREAPAAEAADVPAAEAAAVKTAETADASPGEEAAGSRSRRK